MYKKKDILKRKKWLESKLLVSPKTIIGSMPKAIGEQFQGEWALYSCSMFTQALANISRLYPETKNKSKEIARQLINNVMSPEIKAYDAKLWGNEDPLDSLEHGSEVRHLSYRSHLAWMICNYKFLGGDDEFDKLLKQLCRAMAKGIADSPAMNLPTYSDMAVCLPDMLVAIVALHYYNKLYDGEFCQVVNEWIFKARNDWTDSETGLLVSCMSYNGTVMRPVRGSYSALNTYYLALVDKEFGEQQYKQLKRYFVMKKLFTGCREFLQSTNKFLAFDVDAGPILMGMSPSGTAFLIGSATIFQDHSLRKKLLTTADVIGFSVSFLAKKHYLLSNIAPVGEAIVLAMKTSN